MPETPETPETQERWIPITEASMELRIPYRRLKRIIDETGIATRRDILDRRVVLIDVNRLRKIIER